MAKTKAVIDRKNVKIEWNGDRIIEDLMLSLVTIADKHAYSNLSDARASVAVDTGWLRDTGRVESNVKNNRITSKVIFGEENDISQRAGFTEFGTEKMKAKPYLRPTFKKEKERFKTSCQSVIK